MSAPLQPVLLGPGEGREYRMPSMRAIFKADGPETGDRSCISEWWVDPHAKGPGPHSHETNDEIFYGIAGTMSVLVGDIWHDVSVGGFVFIPAGTVHDFENRTDEPAALFNLFVPGGFETKMPAIVRWFQENEG